MIIYQELLETCICRWRRWLLKRAPERKKGLYEACGQKQTLYILYSSWHAHKLDYAFQYINGPQMWPHVVICTTTGGSGKRFLPCGSPLNITMLNFTRSKIRPAARPPAGIGSAHLPPGIGSACPAAWH